ncbi:GDSL family lipase [Methylocella tundrae]|uniref:GDSL family lipase n=1 Tax=Methylocella tundrae TaxID=227605 RepID=A0A8B6M5M0_METTU|nr:SGNH/GDSL hydrolase family protein [Methylocella tundrae]VTZ27813.1 GDSL family lipase [Methylocella tundrae]VTZ49653.1 GDSL family lipase [Methylocella tundrae]
MARKTIGESAQKGALALAFCVCAALPLRAEEAPAPVAAPPLSPSCEVPAVDIATPASLPNFAAALQKHQAVHILAIGSSSTVGIGSSGSNKSYPSLLEAILEHALKGVDIIVVNRGLPGEVAESTSERIRNEVALSKPDLVLWQLGTNDALARVSPADFEATVQSTIEWLKENQVDVVLVGLQYAPRLARDSNYAAIRDALKSIAAKENVLYISRYDAMRFIAQTRANLQLMSRDNFHLNDLGYQCMAEHVAHAVIISLFMKRVRPLSN